MKTKLSAISIVSAVFLIGCGGGGPNAGTSVFDPTTTSTSDSGSSSVSSNSKASVVLSVSNAQISSSSPGTVTALVRDGSGNPVVGALVTFTISPTIATASPNSVVTNASGEASTTVVPGSSSAAGGAFVTASVEVPGVSTTFTTKVAFSVSALNVTLNAASAVKPSLAAYESTNLNFTVTGASSSNPVKVSLTSTCSQTGKATISPSSVTLTQPSASVAYQDQGCGAPDQVNVSIEGTSQQRSIALTIAAPISTAIQFVSASPSVIGLKGSGSPTSSLVTFKVTDQAGVGQSGVAVDFALDQPNIASLTSQTGTTDSSGNVVVGVSAKSTPSPVRVRAALHSDAAIFVPSSELTINAGRPHQDGFSVAFSKYAMNGNLDGDEASVRLTLGDRYGNPVPDGTRVNLVSEGGVVIPASCTTVSAVCSVKFVVSNPRPTDGRVSVTAYAVGEESFTDANGNLEYDATPAPGEAFEDLGTVFIDKNENGAQDSGEYITGSVANGVWDSNSYVREQNLIIFSTTNVAPRLFAASGNNCTNTELAVPVDEAHVLATIDLSGASTGARCTQSYPICLRDANQAADALGGNPIASGSTLAVATDATGASVSIDNSPISAIVNGPTLHRITVKRATCGTALTSGGEVTLSITTGGVTYGYSHLLKITP